MTFVPNTTPTPNWLYNGEMKKMSETELKVVLLITRKTLGWFDPMTKGRKDQDYISQKMFMEFTGQSNRAIATAIQSCVESGWIIAKDKNGNLCDVPEKRARRKVWYQLGNMFTDKISSSEESSQDQNSSGEHNDTNLVKNVHSTKETIQKKDLLVTNVTNKAGTPAKKGKEDSYQVNKIFEIFQKSINPTINYGHRTNRKAVTDLIKKFGFDKTKRTVEFAMSIQGQKYAPTITTPYQLKEKLGDLLIFWKKNNKRREIIKI